MYIQYSTLFLKCLASNVSCFRSSWSGLQPLIILSSSFMDAFTDDASCTLMQRSWIHILMHLLCVLPTVHSQKTIHTQITLLWILMFALILYYFFEWTIKCLSDVLSLYMCVSYYPCISHRQLCSCCDDHMPWMLYLTRQIAKHA